MCYLVTFTRTVIIAEGAPTQQCQEPFRNEPDAKARAESLAGCEGISDVKVWKLVGEPLVKKTVEWKDNRGG